MGQRHLVEKRLKSVVVAAVYDRDVDGQTGQSIGGVDAGKAATDNDYAGAAGWLGKIGQGVHLTLRMREGGDW